MRLRAGATTDTGRVRDHNEDAFAIRPAQGLFVVCDGMGGEAAGEVASRMAVDTIVEQMSRHPREPGGARSIGRGGYLPQTRRLAEAIARANQAIYDQAQADPRQSGMGTTVVAALVAHNVASVAHVGDSRAYLWHNEHLEQLTRDHSLVEEQVRAGLLEREESLQAGGQNVLLRALGRDPDTQADLSEVPLRAADYLLLCSDGLTRMVPDTELAAAIANLRDPTRICDHLVSQANRNGGTDNITALVVHVTTAWWRRPWKRSRRTA